MFFQEYFVFCDLSFRQHWAVFCRLENGEPIGVTVHSHCLEDLLQRYVSEGWVAVDSKKNTIFPEHPVPNFATGSPHFKNGPHLAFWLDLYRLLCPSVGMPVRYEN